MWGTPANRVKLLRQRHTVRPTTFRGPGMVCEHDGVRIHSVKGGWRHDVPEMVRLNAEAIKVTA